MSNDSESARDPRPEASSQNAFGKDASGQDASRQDASGQDVTVLALISDRPLDVQLVEDFVLAAEYGAMVTFRGVIRNHDHGAAVNALDYSAHPDAQQFLEDCCVTIAEETGLRVAAAHRIGSLTIGDVALVAAVAAPHRAEAFAACERLIEIIKSTVPIWKRQHLADGATEWVGL